MTAPLLRVNGLVTAYGKIEAVKGVSLSVAEGSVTCLLGPNGAGKTTLMLTLAGLLRPRGGAIRFAGHDLTGQPPHEVVARGIALVPQHRLLFPNMSVRENLLAGAYRRSDRRAIEADIVRVCRRFPRLLERQSQRAGTLSGGEQQMLALARALMSRPKLLLMDEPALGLAPRMAEDVLQIIREANKRGTTIFLAEQSAHMALKIAHRVYVMERGHVAFEGDTAPLAEDRRVHRAYRDRAWDEAAPTARI